MKRPLRPASWCTLLPVLLLAGCGGQNPPPTAAKADTSSLPTVSVVGGYASLPANIGGGPGLGLYQLPVSIQFAVTLSAQPNGVSSVSFATVDNTATHGIDYSTSANTLYFQPGETTKIIDVPIIGGGSGHSYTTPTDKTFYLQLQNPSANIALGTSRALGTIMFAPGLTDSGITTCATVAAKGLPCDNAATGTDAYPAQDAEFGRDALAEAHMLSKVGAGEAGFDFTKLDINGKPLLDQTVGYDADPWYCVRDNVTGLFWEVKTVDTDPSFTQHHAGSTYTWFTRSMNSVTPPQGTPGAAGTCTLSACDTADYVDAVNQTGYCGATNWRVPTTAELRSLLDYGRDSGPAVDTGFFPNARQGAYWAVSLSAGPAGRAWTVDFGDGTMTPQDTSTYTFVRLVHSR